MSMSISNTLTFTLLLNVLANNFSASCTRGMSLLGTVRSESSKAPMARVASTSLMERSLFCSPFLLRSLCSFFCSVMSRSKDRRFTSMSSFCCASRQCLSSALVAALMGTVSTDTSKKRSV